MDDSITKSEYEADMRRLDAEDTRQNKRIEKLEDNVLQIGDLTRTVDKLATNMEHMLEEQKAQGKRLEALEGRDGEMWRKVVSYCLTAACGVVIGFLFNVIGIV